MDNIVALSGGQDSTFMLLAMIKKKMLIDKIVFCDTGLEFDEMYDYIKKIEKFINRSVTIIRGDTFDKWFYGKWTSGKHKGIVRGWPKSCGTSWCTRELKTNPMNKLKGIVYLGIASDERHRMQKNQKYRYPLIEWNVTEKMCRNHLEKIGLLNPLYKKFNRTGCFLCPKQPESSLEIIFNEYPDKWKIMKEYDNASPVSFKPNKSLLDLENKFKGKQQQMLLKFAI